MSRGQHTEEEKLRIRESRKKTALRRQSQVVKCYEMKIVEKRLNKRQHEELDMIFLEGKRFYNYVLSEKKSKEIPLNCIVPTDFKNITYLDKNRKTIDYSLEYLPSHYKQTILARMISNEKTIRALVKKKHQTHGSLKFKSDLECIPLKNTDWKFKSANKVWIMGIKGKILVRGSDQIPDKCEFANANLLKKSNGYYLKITCYIDKNKVKQTTINKEIGLDFGIKTNITTSEGQKFDVEVQESDRLKKLHKELFRRVKGSKNKNKTIMLMQRAYQKLSNKKSNQANQIIHMLKQYDRIVMQDEQIAEWHKDKKTRKVVQHSCLGLIKAKLKALPQTIILDKWIPTTKWCPRCGKTNDMPLEKRIYECSCGYHEDRDVHSAKNMLEIKHLVPTEHREVTLMEFKTAIADEILSGKSGQRSEKITSFRM